MISFFLGTQNSNFFKELINKFKFNENRKIIIIIPEQNSFYTEKRAIKLSEFLKKEIEVLSFSRLAYKIFQNFGGITKKTAKKAHKIAIINLVLFQLKNDISTYDYLISKPDFAELILKTIEQIKQNQSNYFQIEQQIKLLNNNSLKLKINEFWLIFKTYNLKLKSIFFDKYDNLKHANILLSSNSNVLDKTQFFFTEFFSFSNLQLEIIETIAKKANIGFHFFCSNENDDVFKETFKTIETIKQIAQKNKIETFTTKIKHKFKKTKTMTTIEKILINPNFKINTNEKIKLQTSNNIKLFAATSIFEEVDWLMLEIINLLKEKNNFNNITILSTNLSLYKSTLICAMEKFKIPFFLDDPISYETMNIIKCCKNLIEAATNKKKLTNCCLNILKSDLTKFSTTEIALFENYIYSLKIDGSKFNEILSKNSNKFIKQNSENLQINLELINTIYKTLMKAIEKIKKSQNTTKSIAINIIKSLKILGIEPENLKICNKQNEKNFKLEWNSLITLLDTIYETTKNSKIELKQFEFIFKSTAKNLNIKQIPPTLNCVLIGSIANTIPNQPKIMFILGASELNFPKKQFSSCQLFSDYDLTKLKELGIIFGKTLNQQNNLNKLISHRAICSATNKLFLSFTSNQNQFGSNEPCQIIKTLQNFFNIKINTENSMSNFLVKCTNTKTAIKQLALHYNEKNEQIEALKTYFKNNKKFKIESNTLLSKLNKKFRNIKTINSIKTISPSQIEQFFLCPFSYFCKNILKIKPITKIEINNKTLGLIFHKILEKIVSIKNFKNMNSCQIKTEIKKQYKNLIENNITIKLQSSIKFHQTFKNYENILLKLFQYIQQELKTSNFKPAFFEYEIGPKSKIKDLKIKLKNKKYISIVGKIDRIDTKKTNDNKTLFRIIDYKTGDKNLNFSDLIHGLNLQMLLYAMTIYNMTSNKLNENLINAIEYIKILGNLTTYSINERNPSNEKIEKIKNKGFFKNGLVFLNDYVNEEIILQALPLKLNKNNKIQKNELESKILTKAETKLLFQFIKLKIESMCETINNFNFKHISHLKNFNSTNKQTNCSFCDYKEICNPNSIETLKHNPYLKKVEFFEIVKKELEIET